MSTINKIIFSIDKKYKATIYQDVKGHFSIKFCRWVCEDVPDSNLDIAFWEEFSSPSLTDTLTRAEEIARRELQAWSGEPPLEYNV